MDSTIYIKWEESTINCEGYEEWDYCNVHNKSGTVAFQKNNLYLAERDNANDDVNSIGKVQFYPRTGAVFACIFEPVTDDKPVFLQERTEDGTNIEHDGRAMLSSPEFYHTVGIVSPPQDEFDNIPLDLLFNGCSEKSLYVVQHISCLETWERLLVVDSLQCLFDSVFI
jgi:hypothetical protein